MHHISNHFEPKLLQSYQLFYEDSSTPFLIRKNDTWLYANTAALNLLGIKQKRDFIGTKVSDWIKQEKTVMEKWIYQQKIVSIDLLWKTTQGQEVYLETHNIPIVESPNMFQVFIRKSLSTNYNQSLNDNELKLIADHTTDMVGVLDLTGKFIYISPSYQEVTGYIPELAIGKNAFDLVHPSEREVVFQRFLNIIHNREILTVECKFLHARNDYIWLETHVIPVVEDEKVKHAIVVSRDITKRKETEENLRKSEAQHRIILKHSNDLICVVTTEGLYEYASPSYKYILGYEPKDIVGKNVFSYVHEEDIPKFKEYLSLPLYTLKFSRILTFSLNFINT
jgi:two-component system, sporulation sensor kinase A